MQEGCVQRSSRQAGRRYNEGFVYSPTWLTTYLPSPLGVCLRLFSVKCACF